MNKRLTNNRLAALLGAMCLLAAWASAAAATVTIAVPHDATGVPGRDAEIPIAMLIDVESGQFLAAASPAAGIPVALLAVMGGLVLFVILAVLLTRRGKGQRT